jgi:hypothetical protein
LTRLYLPAYTTSPDALARHLQGQASVAVDLATLDGRVRALAIPFVRAKGEHDEQHWLRLCDMANGWQEDLGLPAPAVSIDGADGYRLWLSLAAPVPAEQARRFVEALCDRYCPEMSLPAGLVDAPVELPPSLNARSGKWAAFIHPGMGTSFADDPGLDMAPPPAGQIAFLEGLESIAADAFRQALDKLAPAQPQPVAEAPAAAPVPLAADAPRAANDAAFPGDLLLREATLEDIVRFLHAKGIEPTFRHVLR